MASREEKSLRHVNIVAQLLVISINCCPANMEKDKQTNKLLTCMTLLCMTGLRNKLYPIRFVPRSTMQMAVSVKKDC